jgi:hypothetical protein
MNNLAMLRTRADNRQGQSRRSRTALNEAGSPYRNLRVKRFVPGCAYAIPCAGGCFKTGEVITALPVQAVDAVRVQEADVPICRLRREQCGQTVKGLRAVSGIVQELAECFADIAVPSRSLGFDQVGRVDHVQVSQADHEPQPLGLRGGQGLPVTGHEPGFLAVDDDGSRLTLVLGAVGIAGFGVDHGGVCRERPREGLVRAAVF